MRRDDRRDKKVLMEIPVINVIQCPSECSCVGFNDAWGQFVQF
jgi:hypothetical protein